jgi:peroxiredoxin
MGKKLVGMVALGLALLAASAAGQELRPWKGGATPPLALADLEGKRHDLEAYRGKVLLVNFWATWCEPCTKEMPSMRRLRASLAGRPFEVLAVNLGEGEGRIRRFLEQVPLDFPVLLDADKSVAKSWKARILPASYLVGPDGRIRYSVLGEIDWDAEPARKAVASLLPISSIPPPKAPAASSR